MKVSKNKKYDKKTICLIAARGGSKGVKGKNTRILGNKPLIAHTIEKAIKYVHTYLQ